MVQNKDGVAWHGPALVICQRGNTVFIHSNGEIRKVAACKVKPCELKKREVDRKEENTVENRDENRWNKIIEEDERVEDKDAEMEDEQVMTEDGLKDVIGAKYLKMDKIVCFLEN